MGGETELEKHVVARKLGLCLTQVPQKTGPETRVKALIGRLQVQSGGGGVS